MPSARYTVSPTPWSHRSWLDCRVKKNSRRKVSWLRKHVSRGDLAKYRTRALTKYGRLEYSPYRAQWIWCQTFSGFCSVCGRKNGPTTKPLAPGRNASSPLRPPIMPTSKRRSVLSDGERIRGKERRERGRRRKLINRSWTRNYYTARKERGRGQSRCVANTFLYHTESKGCICMSRDTLCSVLLLFPSFSLE